MLELLERTFPLDKPFTLQEIYPVVEDDLQRQYPNSNSIKQTIRSNLQKLRDDGIITFDDEHPGTYHWALTSPLTLNEPVIGTVYILKNLVGGGGYKIGVSRVIENRLKQLEVPVKAEVMGLWQSPNYTDLERMLHRKYADVRVPQSEWFNLSKTELIEAAQWLNENASQKECHIEVPITSKSFAPLPLMTVVWAVMLLLQILYVNHRISLLQ